jgi:signal transduction histidine kinase
MRVGLAARVLVGVVVQLAALLTLLIWAFRRDVVWLERSELEDQGVIAEAIAVAVDRQLDTATGIGWAIAADPRVQTFDPAVLDPYLNALARASPLTTSIGVFDARGANRGYGSPTAEAGSPRLSIADRDYFRRVMATNVPTVSSLLTLRAVHTPGVVVGVPIRDESGRAVGVVSVAMDAERLAREYQHTSVRAGEALFVVDRDGRLAFDTARPALTSTEADALRGFAPLVSALSGQPNSVAAFTSPLHGDERLGAFTRTARYNWGVGVTIPRGVALAPVYARLREELLAFGLIAALTIGLSVLLSRLLVHPLRVLQGAALALGRGDLSRRVRITTRDEIGDLGACFDDMAARLDERNRALQQARGNVEALNAQLEGRVASRTSELEAANRELEAFSYSVSHDLRGPLRAVDGFVSVTLEAFQDTLPTAAVHHLERAQSGARRMAQIIDGLLALSRAARAPLTRVAVDMVALARETMEDLKDTAAKPVETVVGLLPPAFGDPVLLRQVLANLVSNALKYSRDRDTIRLELGFAPGPPTAYFVRDNGVGFDTTRAEKLFQPFQRLQQPREYEGTGIGLAIVQRVVARHGGRVWAESKPGEGATFWFTLAPDGSPLTPAPPA